MGIRPRVLLVGPYWLGGWTDSVYRAFLQHDCAVERVYYNDPVSDTNSRKIKGTLKIRSWPYLIKHTGYALRGKKFESVIYRVACEFQPDLILILKGEILLPATLRKLKKIDSRPAIATWWVDNPIVSGEAHRWLTFPHCIPCYDKLFVFDYSYFDALKLLGAKEVIFLPCGADPSIYHPETLTDEQVDRLESSVCFVWSFYPSRADLLKAFLDIPGVGVWGGGWEEYLRDAGNNTRIIKGDSLQPSEVNSVYQAATVVVNSHHAQTKKGGLNTRSFEILASGGLELVDYVPGMEELLVPGEEVIVYRNPAEAAQLARTIIDNVEDFVEVRRKGCERVMSEHTYYHRAGSILASFSLA